jgi:FkbM family methyltransferase
MAENELEELLGESPDSARRRERQAYDRVADRHGDSIVIFGAGGLGRKLLAGLRKVGITPLAFVDNNRELWGTLVEGVPVRQPEDAAAELGDSATFVIAIMRVGGGHLDARRKLAGLGCKRIVPFAFLAWKYSEIYLPYYNLDLPHKALEAADSVRSAFDLMADDASRREFLAQLRFRLRADFEALHPPVPGEQYFPEDLFAWSPDEVFVDCGAFDGDTIGVIVDRYGDGFERLLAFEPDPINYQKLERYVGSLRPSLKEKIAKRMIAAGAEDCMVRFSASGTLTSAVGDGDTMVECKPLDDLLSGVRPTFVKMDIEGSEPEALAGLRKTIERDAPLLAFCAYHLQDHLWRLPMLIRSFTDRYRYHLRPHNDEGFDLVCYAVPEGRQLNP